MHAQQLRSGGVRRLSVNGPIYLALAVLAVATLAPLAWAVSSSLKSEAETWARPYSWIPRDWEFRNYRDVFAQAPLGRHFLNSMIYAAGQLAIAATVVPMAGYVLARKRFPGRDAIFVFILCLMIIPRQATVVHLFVLVKNFPLLGGNNLFGQGGRGLVDSFPGLILPRAADPFVIFVMRQFFWNLPRDLESAARIDGASEWRTYTNIMLPLALPGLSVLVIFTFEDAWNDFLWPLIVLYSERLYTVQIGLLQFQTDTGAFWNWLMAATVSVTVPMIVVFLVFQRYFFKGITFEGFTK